MLALLVDALIVVLLLVVLGRGFQLQRHLRELRQDDGEIDRLIAALDRATARAEAALDGLRQTALATHERLAGQLTSSQRLIDDLQFLTGRGEQAADRLVEQIGKERPVSQRAQTTRPAPTRRGPRAGRTGRCRRPTSSARSGRCADAGAALAWRALVAAGRARAAGGAGGPDGRLGNPGAGQARPVGRGHARPEFRRISARGRRPAGHARLGVALDPGR